MASPEADWTALRRTIEGLPQAPVPVVHPRRWMGRIKRGADFIGHARYDAARFFAKTNPYPKPFKHLLLEAEDGVRIAAWMGPHRPTQPKSWGLVIVPGMFSTKDDTVHKRRALRIWRYWRIPVVVIDLRGFGESRGISTAGWKEAYDVLAAARYLRDECHVERVGIVAESLGGAAALNAAGIDAERGDGIITGGVVTWSAFVDAKDAVEYITARPPAEHPFAPSWMGFRRLLGMKTMGGYAQFTDFLDDAARVNGLADAQELYAEANPKRRAHLIATPTLLVHSTDDPVVPVRHARRMERYAGDNPNVQVILTGWGKHTNFEATDKGWYWEVMRRWFGAVNGEDLPMPGTGRIR